MSKFADRFKDLLYMNRSCLREVTMKNRRAAIQLMRAVDRLEFLTSPHVEHAKVRKTAPLGPVSSNR